MTIGHIHMKQKLIALICAAALTAGQTLPAFSDPVEMHMRGGGLVIKGDLVSVRDNAGLITSPDFGAIVLEVDRYECRGPGCIILGEPETVVALPNAAPDATFGIRGSNTVGEALTPALIEAYGDSKGYLVEKRVGANAEEIEMEFLDQNRQRIALIDAQSYGSGTSASNLLSGGAEIGASSRPIKDSERQALIDAGLSVNEHVLALDGLPVIVSPSNPLDRLTLEQVAQIFAGKITDWSQVGGNPGAITLYARDDKSGTYDTFENLV
nr:substrate-binding domain-containing protein [Hyphomicrobiales bacterium]